MDIQTTGIIGRASAVNINYRKWAGLRSILQTLSSKFDAHSLLGSGAIAFQKEVRIYQRSDNRIDCLARF